MSPPGLIDQLSAFSAALRGRGLVVTPDQTADMARALTLVDLARSSQARASLRSLAVTDQAPPAPFAALLAEAGVQCQVAGDGA